MLMNANSMPAWTSAKCRPSASSFCSVGMGVSVMDAVAKKGTSQSVCSIYHFHAGTTLSALKAGMVMPPVAYVNRAFSHAALPRYSCSGALA